MRGFTLLRPGAVGPVGVLGPLLHIIGTGQSLSTGDFGTPPLSLPNYRGNVQLKDTSGNYSTASPFANTLALAPLLAPARNDKYTGGGGDASQYPSNIGGESPEIAMANTLNFLLSKKFASSSVGQGGAAMSVIQKGGTGNAYAAAIYEAQAIAALATGYGFSSYQTLATMLTHGEADAAVTPATYQAQVATLQANLQADLRAAISGQPTTIPMLVSQQNAFPITGGGAANSSIAQWLAVKAGGGVVGTTPKYQYPYQSDRAHLTAAGYRLLGEKMAEALYLWVTNGSYSPLIATSVSRSTNVVTVTFNVPVGPLQWDGVSSAPHQSGAYAAWASGKGFEAFSGGYGGTVVTINSVAISGNTVVITCASAPDTIAYAMTQDVASGYTGGFPDGRCGLLMDSDTFAGLSGTAQTNRAWAFVQAGL